MKYRFDISLSLEDDFRRLLSEQGQHILNLWKDPEEIHHVVHETRRSLKRIRAILRLIRDEMGYSGYYRENCYYRDLAVPLSRIRDIYVIQQSLDEFLSADPELGVEDGIDEFSRYNQDQIRLETDSLTGNQTGAVIHRKISEGLSRVTEYCVIPDNFQFIEKGIRRNYRKGQHYLNIVERNFSEEAFHELRKKSKYFLHHLQLMQPLLPKIMKSFVKSVDRFTELLGETRDLYLLDREATRFFRGHPVRDYPDRLRTRIQQERTRIIQDILTAAGWVYLKDPEAISGDFTHYWQLSKSK